MSASTPKKNSFFGGAAILTASVIVVKLIGALYKIPLGGILSDAGFADFNTAYNIYSLLIIISTGGLPVALSKMVSEANALGRVNQVKRCSPWPWPPSACWAPSASASWPSSPSSWPT